MKLDVSFSRVGRVLAGLQVGAVLFLAGIEASSGETLVYEGFVEESGYSETAGADGRLQEQSIDGPLGFGDGRWTVKSSKGGTGQFLFRKEKGLSHASLSYPKGGGIEITPASDGSLTISRKVKEAFLFQGQTDFYMSFLMKVDGFAPTGTAYATFSQGFGGGIRNGKLVIVSRGSKGGNLFFEGEDYKAGETYYFVIKLIGSGDEWAGNELLEALINPGDPSNEYSAADVYITDPESTSGVRGWGIGSLTIQVEGFEGVTVQFDEFCLGTSWQSVTAPDE